ncbi:MAG: ABC transporter ATP-binding protein [Firmicutes bacterium]|nr:ABC transporter ATP-binding protein [Bacillota bacterium]
MLYIFRHLSSYLAPYKKAFGLAVTLTLVQNGLNYLFPQFIKGIFDRVFPGIKEEKGLLILLAWCAGILLLGLLRAAVLRFGIINYEGTANRIAADLRNALYEKLHKAPLSYYGTMRTGDLMSRLTLDVQMVQMFFSFVFSHALSCALTIGAVILLMFLASWKMALIVLAFLPVIIVALVRFSRRTAKGVKDRQEQAGSLTAVLQENITGIRVVKSFATEEQEIEKFREENWKLRGANLRVTLLNARMLPLLILFSGAGTLVVLGVGGWLVSAGEITIGSFMAFNSYLGLLGWPMWMLAPTLSHVKQAEGSARRLLEIFQAPEEARPVKPVRRVIRGEIRFKDVSFEYTNPEGTVAVLEKINLRIDPGEKVAVIGLTGSGKSTLVNLIPRLFRPTSGKIYLDGIDLNDWDLDSLRRQIGLVDQETFLFSTTIGENIAFGAVETGPEAERARAIINSAQKARIHDFIVSLPEHYNTIVGERGVGLSGGQKQRVAIARALFTNPKILILDDSTSSVDPETEKEIQESLKELMAGRTTIIVTQRMSMARLADRIILLSSGEIKAEGEHGFLYDSNQYYRLLHDIQLKQVERPEEELLRGLEGL